MPTLIPTDEFRQRQARAAAAAGERGYDALLVWSRGGTSLDFYGDVFYLANHHTPFPPNQDTPQWSARTYSALVLPAEGEPALVVDLPEFDAAEIQVDDVRSTLHVTGATAELLREKGLDRGRLGLVGRDTLLLHHLHGLEEELGHPLRLEPADEIVERMRMVKSDAELQMVRRAADVGIGWMSAMLEAAEPGRTDGEIVGEGLRYLAGHGGFAYDVAVASGDQSKHLFGRLAIPAWDSERRLRDGDLIHLDAWGAIDGYYTDFSRSTVVGGSTTGAQESLLEAPIDLIEHILAGIEPGVPVGELYARGASWMGENGFGEHRGTSEEGTDFGSLFPAFGHSFGVGLEPPWVIEDEPTVVAENMCLAIETLLGRPDVGGAGFEQDVIVTADGCEVITAACPSRWWAREGG
jgi:Xaa-Pro dipeptidase